ncbi:MAG TPA: MEDS domain-containing protein [Candidatus Thermoplasmatota archaeon]|nr:MEDS domain-containing protein [Candidatus Thermoplasmatota archaeon]
MTQGLAIERPWSSMLREGANHVVQVYRSSPFLHEAVALWAEQAVEDGGGVILIGSAANLVAVRTRLEHRGLPLREAEREGRFVALDAEHFMPLFMVNGRVDVETFDRVAGAIVDRMARALPGRPLRAWGEMVNLLASRGNPEEAHVLEGAWNRLIDRSRLQLLCSYQADARDPYGSAPFRRLLETHSHLLQESNESVTEALRLGPFAPAFWMALGHASVAAGLPEPGAALVKVGSSDDGGS